MNKHGQTLILFVILIPMILILCGLVVDLGLAISKKTHLREVTQMVIQDVIENDLSKEKVEQIFLKNGIAIDQLEFIKTSDVVEIKNEINIDSIFGVIVGKKSYQVKIDIKGYLKNGKIVFE